MFGRCECRAEHAMALARMRQAMLLTAPTIVDEEALLVMKRHSDTPLNTTCTAKPRLRQIAALSAGKQHALRFAAAHHALKF